MAHAETDSKVKNNSHAMFSFFADSLTRAFDDPVDRWSLRDPPLFVPFCRKLRLDPLALFPIWD
jgi:hypothetical protein